MIEESASIILPNINTEKYERDQMPRPGFPVFYNQVLTTMYPLAEGLHIGTIFPELNIPMEHMKMMVVEREAIL